MNPASDRPPGATSPAAWTMRKAGIRPRRHGFTLVELVMAILLIAILAGATAAFIVSSIQGYVGMSRRAALVEAAEGALRRMARDIHVALPNSVRITNIGGGGYALELIPTIDGGRYCDAADVTASRCTNALAFAANVSQFDLIGCFRDSSTPATSGLRLVVNNLGITGNDVYADGVTPAPPLPLVITPLATAVSISQFSPNTCPTGGNHRVTFTPGHWFRSGSSGRRVYAVQTPVTYLCVPNATDPASGTLVRYASYAIQASQLATAASLNALAGVTSATVADRMSACTVTTTTTQIQSLGIVTLTLTLGEESEIIQLVQQVTLDNSQ